MVSCSPRRSSVMLDPHQTLCLEHLVMWPIITYLPNPKMRLYYLEAFLFSCDVWLNYKSKKREIYLFSYLLHVYIYFFSPTNDWINVLLISSTTFTVQFYCVKKSTYGHLGKTKFLWFFFCLQNVYIPQIHFVIVPQKFAIPCQNVWDSQSYQRRRGLT